MQLPPALARQPEAIQVQVRRERQRSCSSTSRATSHPARPALPIPTPKLLDEQGYGERARCDIRSVDQCDRRQHRRLLVLRQQRAAAQLRLCPDGAVRREGRGGQQLRLSYLGYGGKGGIGDTNASTLNSQPARKLYTCTGTCSANSALSGYPFEYNNAATSGAITTTALGAADATALQTMIKWIRGQDTATRTVPGERRDTDVRASIHGDVLHSRPVVLDFGSSTGIFVFYGGNDGVFRAVKGGQAADRRQGAMGASSRPSSSASSSACTTTARPCCTPAPARRNPRSDTARLLLRRPGGHPCRARRQQRHLEGHPVHQHAPRRTADLRARRHHADEPEVPLEEELCRLRVCRAGPDLVAADGHSREREHRPGAHLRRRLRQRVRGHRAPVEHRFHGAGHLRTERPAPARPCGRPASRARTSQPAHRHVVHAGPRHGLQHRR